MTILRTRMSLGPVFGTFVKLPRPEIVGIAALAGFDFIICDYEHAQMDERDILETVRAGRVAELPVLVRLPGSDRGLINRVLEAGAAGIQLARITAPDAAELTRLMRYPPLGTRSISLGQPSAGYGTQALTEYMSTSNAQALAVGQFETRASDDSLDEAVAALDVAFIGPVDLSVDLGHPGNINAEPVQMAISAIEAAAARADTPMGTFVTSRAAAAAALDRGYRYLVISSDIAMLMSGARQALADLPGSNTQG